MVEYEHCTGLLRNIIVAQPVDSLYFHVSGILPTNFILQFAGQADEEKHSQLLAAYLQERKPTFNWFQGGSVHVMTTLVDNFSPARIDSFLFARPADHDQTHKHTEILMPDGRCIPLHLELLVVSYYTFNSAVFHIKARIPADYWQDEPVLKRVRFFLQKTNATIDGYKTDLETLYGGTFNRLNNAVNEAIDVIKPPTVSSTFFDLTLVDNSTDYVLGWSHATLVLISSRYSRQEMVHQYEHVLIRHIPGGIRDYSVSEDAFIYVESGDSLLVKPIEPYEDPKIVEEQLYSEWMFWLATEHYTWKVVWEIDRVLYVILTTVTSHLRQKLDSPYQDIYELNGLLNYIKLLLDVLTPRNLTSNFSKIHFLEEVNTAWQTDAMQAAAEKKMEQLSVVVTQLNEIRAKRQSKRVELLLISLSIISSGTLISNILRATSFDDDWSDPLILAVVIGFPALLTIIAVIYLSQTLDGKEL